ncbi:MAG: hypothetical protein YK1309IOTA_2080002 [Marine Group I thaumarchaeote]|nr:MAG: hypothetical protein YK1309IOTA_2080002 [Marine Group I thaumarchaeote]
MIYTKNVICILMTKKIEPLEQGVIDMAKILDSWRTQPNPPKVYIFGKRVHHGLVSAAMGLLGFYTKDPYLVGAGIVGVVDDFGDIDHWLDFESGGNPNSILDIV